MSWKQPRDRFLPDVAKPEQEENRSPQRRDRQGRSRNSEKNERDCGNPTKTRCSTRSSKSCPRKIRVDTKTALRTDEEKRTEIQKYLVKKFGEKLAVKLAEVDEALAHNPRHSEEQEKLDQKIATLERYKRSYGKIQALWGRGGPPPTTRLLQRGAVESPGPPVKTGPFWKCFPRPAARTPCARPARKAKPAGTGSRSRGG